VRFRWSRTVPPDAKSYRVTKDRAGRWHVAFAVIPAPVPAPGNHQVVGVDRGVAVSAALSTGQPLHCPALSARERARLRRLQRNAAVNIAAGHAVTARGGDGVARPVNREPQLLLPSG
jgi:putative transposase